MSEILLKRPTVYSQRTKL